MQGYLRVFYKRYLLEHHLSWRSRSLRKQLQFCGKDVRFRGKYFVSKPKKMIVGNNVHIGDNAYFKSDGGLRIGDHVTVSRNCTIYTSSHNYMGTAIPYDSGHLFAPVHIADNVWIGMNVSIVPGVSVGEGAVIGLGAVVTKDVPACAVVGGNPAKIIKTRDQEHYRKLLSEGSIADHAGKILPKQRLDDYPQVPDLLQDES